MSRVFAKQYAKFYDLFYKDKQYEKETERLSSIILDKFGDRFLGVVDVLDVACGTGGHARYLADNYRVFVQDASQAMYELCKEKLKKKVNYLGVQRMESFRHWRRFDVILALFSSIDYSTNLDKTLANFYKHLRKDGLVMFDFWNKEVVEDSFDLLRITPLKRSETMLYPGKQIAKVKISFAGKEMELHNLRYYSITQMMDALRRAGFKNVEMSPWTEDLWNILAVARK